ncbi:uncharacterized protein [Apostichopus japonicus]|uniref:uncharacterized protein isoform X2 n=1 Tax=Stichopus japonicus TaxID=307972 RepID=UPI003AB30D11
MDFVLVCCEDVEMKDFLLRAETELFCYRFSNMNTSELTHILKSTHKFVSSCLGFQSCAKDEALCDLYMTFEMIYASVGSWKTVVKKYMKDCTRETFQIPFQLALSLIASRQILVTKGLAQVPFSKLHVILSYLFRSVLCKGLEKAGTISSTSLYNEKRTSDLLHNLRIFCQRLLGKTQTAALFTGQETAITCDEIKQEAYLFPPCMYYPYRVLLQRHRLRHHSRIQFTLFLKEVGLPMTEALTFWKHEYSLPEVDKSGKEINGEHSWQKDRKRYTYNIRHLYGLEGSKIDYKAHSCKFLQSYSPGPGEVGGCPFSQSDENHLKYLMDIEEIGPAQQNVIQDLSKSKLFTAACKEYHKLKLSNLRRAEKNDEGAKRSHREEGSRVVANITVKDAGREGAIRSRESLSEEMTSLKSEERVGEGRDSISAKAKMKKVGNNCSNENNIAVDQKHERVAHRPDNLKYVPLEVTASGKRIVSDQLQHGSVNVKRWKRHHGNKIVEERRDQFNEPESGYESEQISRTQFNSVENRSSAPIGIEPIERLDGWNEMDQTSTLPSQPATSSGVPYSQQATGQRRNGSIKGFRDDEFFQSDVKVSSPGNGYRPSQQNARSCDFLRTPIEKRKELISRDLDNLPNEDNLRKPIHYYHSYKKLVSELKLL